MEIKYPIVVIISLIIFVLLFIFSNKLKIKIDKKNKNKIANTNIIKNTKEYKSVLKKYKIFLYIAYGLIFISTISVSVLSSRIVEEQSHNDEIYNRDILLCMDASGSVYELNAELVNSYKQIVANLHGERFGISIFNTSSFLLVPLTDDYDYVNDALDKLHDSFSIWNHPEDYADLDYDERSKIIRYILYGTLVNSEERGSSLAGDGLASCVYSLSQTEQNRSKIIIFSTDNDVYGDEYINVSDAAKLSKSKDITIYSISPDSTSTTRIEPLKYAANITGGGFYIHNEGPTVESIVSEIEKKEKSRLEQPPKIVIVDYPLVPFIVTLIAFILLLIIDKVVLL